MLHQEVYCLSNIFPYIHTLLSALAKKKGKISTKKVALGANG